MRMLEMFKDIKGGSEIIRKDNDYKIPDRFWKQTKKTPRNEKCNH